MLAGAAAAPRWEAREAGGEGSALQEPRGEQRRGRTYRRRGPRRPRAPPHCSGVRRPTPRPPFPRSSSLLPAPSLPQPLSPNHPCAYAPGGATSVGMGRWTTATVSAAVALLAAGVGAAAAATTRTSPRSFAGDAVPWAGGVVRREQPTFAALPPREPRAGGLYAIANRGGGTVSLLNADKGEVVDTYTLPKGGEPMYVGTPFGRSEVWVGDRGNSVLVRFSSMCLSVPLLFVLFATCLPPSPHIVLMRPRPAASILYLLTGGEGNFCAARSPGGILRG